MEPSPEQRTDGLRRSFQAEEGKELENLRMMQGMDGMKRQVTYELQSYLGDVRRLVVNWSTSDLAMLKHVIEDKQARKFQRTAHKELVFICSDQPGLLGPKALFEFKGPCFSRDEINRLLGHNENPPPRQGKEKSQEDLEDRYLPKLLFHREEQRSLIGKYSQVIQRYDGQYLAGYDHVALAQKIQTTYVTSEQDNDLLSSICTKITELSADNVEDPNHVFDFRGLRLDRGRLQSYLSSGKNPALEQQRDQAALLDTVSFHTRMVDNLDKMNTKTSDLSLFCCAINYGATISVREAGNTAGKGPGKGGSSTAGKGPGKGGSRSQTTTGDQMIANL